MNKKVGINKLFFVLIVVLAVLFQAVPFKNILFDVYKWHVIQPETYQGGLFLFIIFFTLVLVSLKFNGRVFNFVLTAVVVLYLRIYQVLEIALYAYIYFEIIVSIGRSFLNYKPNNAKRYLASFLVGHIIWLVFALVISLLGYGRFEHLRFLTVILGLLSLMRGFHKPMIVHFYNLIENKISMFGKISISFLTILILMQFNKSNSAFDYDSLWYGLRPEYVLVGSHSFFDNLGMVSFVYYYPKLVELFFLPLSNLGDYSFIYAGNIITYILLVVLIISFLIISNINVNNAIFYACVICSLPAISNMASTAKPDIFTSFLITMGMYFLWNWLLEKKHLYLYLGLSSLILSFGGKLTSFAFSSMIILGLLIILIYNKFSKVNSSSIQPPTNKIISIKNLIIIIGAVVVLIGLCLRTFLLTGVPFYPVLGSIWSRMGFVLKYPFSTKNVENIASQEAESIIARWFHLFFDPDKYPHIIMLWTGNVMLFLFIIILSLIVINNKVKINLNNKLFLMFTTPICLIGIYYGTIFPSGGDGNIYQAPIIAFLVLGFCLLQEFQFNYKKIIFASLVLFVIFQNLITLVSHPSWIWGTSKIEYNLTKSIKTDNNTTFFQYHQLDEIEKYILEHNGEGKRCIGGFGDDNVFNRLSCRFESINTLSSPLLGNNDLISSVEKFDEFIHWANIEYIILPNEYEGFDAIKNLISSLENNSHNIKITTEKYFLIDLSKSKYELGSNLENGVRINGWYQKEKDYYWVNKESQLLLKSRNQGEVLIKGSIPDQNDNLNLKIYSNDDLVVNKTFSKGPLNIVISVEKNADVELRFDSDKSFIPSNLGINNDTRELAFVVYDIIAN
ncbi:hypothetical protein [Paenibacillus eucommiae]|uniref:Glycosyltransferase RgtA/B/C/D-like domain-containing protein n=1 Tax=Paenibacillus eucommiae TaxID=1355755 RepID=A0ABS4IUB0_9BACL|nr:hypothetical protein [Paenibacillus eucommiae]MBP1991143.1 hypothetical protein [Paenibacillus eucommiae]